MWTNAQVRRMVAMVALAAMAVGIFAGGIVATLSRPAPAPACIETSCDGLYVWPDDLEVEVQFTPEIDDPYARCVAVLTVAEVPASIGQCRR